MAKIVDIPGGHATLAEGPHEVTERKLRPLKSLAALYGRKMDEFTDLVAAQVPDAAGNEVEGVKLASEPPDLSGFTPEDLEHMWEMQSATTWAYLLSWDLDRPLPATWRDMGDLPASVAQALDAEAARIVRESRARAGFTVDSVEDETSPTGASGD